MGFIAKVRLERRSFVEKENREWEIETIKRAMGKKDETISGGDSLNSFYSRDCADRAGKSRKGTIHLPCKLSRSLNTYFPPRGCDAVSKNIARLFHEPFNASYYVRLNWCEINRPDDKNAFNNSLHCRTKKTSRFHLSRSILHF